MHLECNCPNCPLCNICEACHTMKCSGDMEVEDAYDVLHKLMRSQSIELDRLREIEEEWLLMWATLEDLNLVADVRKNMTEHGFVFPTDEAKEE